MLSALELVGFKSFADKTQFDFPRGITAVVGPNGSGKSNVVDAIKWVLGEQSVKSLRGKEMADVIFNGSSNRAALNAAETTLTFDNSSNLLPIDTPQVHITRRVYRNGEGEYLINRQPARLRDIRDLFRGTGVTTEAYGVIEQGKVDVLLQASARDRRMIFEEAAGISRFKAKKIESLRRLERVEQNLLRLADIVEEVDGRLRSVRKQASKAHRYKQYSDRLQDLRTQIGLTDWRRLGSQLLDLETEAEELRDLARRASAEVELRDAKALALETEITEIGELLRKCEARGAENRERIASRESAIEHERRRGRDVEEEIARHRRHLAIMNSRAGDLGEQLHQTATAVRDAEGEHTRLSGQAERDAQHLGRIVEELDALRQENERRRSAYMEQMRAEATLNSRIAALETQRTGASEVRERGRDRLTELETELRTAGDEAAAHHGRQDELTRQRDDVQKLVERVGTQLKRRREQHAVKSKDLAELSRRHAAACERATVLEELEKRFEGVGTGVKQLLLRSRESREGPFDEVCGLVADVLQANVESAPLIEAALGEMTQFLVVRSGASILEYVEREAYHLSGRVGIVRLDFDPMPQWTDEIDLEGQPGVIGRADRFVETETRFSTLAARLLGQTWVVEKLSHALRLSESVGRGLQFVTLAGERVAPDGSVVVGPVGTSTGLISRRSELRLLKQQIAGLNSSIEDAQNALADLQSQIDEDRADRDRAEGEYERTGDELTEHQVKVGAAEQRLAQVNEQIQALKVQCVEAEERCAVADHSIEEARRRLGDTESRLEEMEAEIAEGARHIEELDRERQSLESRNTSAKVRLAKSEERLGNLRVQMHRFEQDQNERRRSIDEHRGQLQQCHGRSRQASASILRAESELAHLYLSKEELARESVAQIQSREACRGERVEISAEVQHLRERIRRLEESLHGKELAASEIRLQRDSLSTRLRDDYSIELAELEHEPTEEELHRREEVDEEISELRRKIQNIGNVNLDALSELEELETRYASLSGQHQDLASAKDSLQRIIDKINADSRRMFSETLESVRDHFRELFRKLFGGGQADIILEEGSDILDGGIEIVARPPGKEPRSISLLSGGEKTLTCVALLLAIFRSRPSPFCVLDEVDAALDEANIERFIGVLKEFLAWTQFIIVTHSKKTMTCANTLYGVTMQESGISKRVSVRFDDVSEDGNIHLPDTKAEVEQPEEPGDETQAA